MVLNYIWIAFFVIAFAVAVVRLLFMGDTEVFPAIMNSTFDTAKTAFEISIGLTGVLSLWLGIMKIGERGGVVNALARVLSPVFTRLFPGIPKGHPATGSIFMNIAANMLGLDNAATPLGLKAMEQLQTLNPRKDTATDPMIMFLVLNTSGLTIIPVSIMVYRAQMGAEQPTDVFVPLLLATFCSTMAGIIATSIYQRINLINRTMVLTLGGMCAAAAAIIWGFGSMDKTTMSVVSTSAANILLFLIIIMFILAGVRKKVNVYDAFIEGAKAIEKLGPHDKVLIAEACTHAPLNEDIGREKLPRWLRKKAGETLATDICAGPDFPKNLRDYALILHCGGCMFTRKQLMSRIIEAQEANVPITNYGVAIAQLNGILDRVTEVFRK